MGWMRIYGRSSWLSLCLATGCLTGGTVQAAINWDGGGATNWWFNPVNWSQDAGCPTTTAVCYLPPAQDSAGNPVNTDAQINGGTGAWDLTGEGVVYDPVNDPFFAAASSLRYPTGSTLKTNSILNRDYGPETLYRLYVSRNTTNSNTLTIKSGDLAIESTTIIGRSGSTGTGAGQQNLGRVVQTGGVVRFPLIGVDLGQREASGWGNGVWDYRGGTLEISSEGTGALRLSHGSTTAGVGPGGVGRFIMHNPTSGGHALAWNVQSASFAGAGTDGVFDALDPDGVTTGVGIWEFHFENGNTRPFQVLNNFSINNGLDSTTGGTRSSRLDLRLNAAPAVLGGIPQNLGLFDVDSDNDGGGIIQGTGSLAGTFSSADGSTNYPEGAMVSAIFGSTKYNWTITYQGNISWSDQINSVVNSINAVGGRDIVLIGQSIESAPGLPGDFNGDLVVNAADYTVWRDHLGSTTALPNDNGLGTPIGSAHYDLWKSNFQSGAGALGAAAVPEPAAVATCLLSAVGLFGLRRRNA